MIVKTYKAAPKSHLSDKDAVRVGEFLDRKFGDRPRTPDDVVRAAKPKSSPIHGDFEWDDAAAASSFRIEQAKYLLRSVHVVLINGEEKAPTRAYHSVRVTSGDETATAYVPARVVWETPEYSEQVVAQAASELESWQRRYREYREHAKLVAAVAQVGAIAEELAA